MQHVIVVCSELLRCRVKFQLRGAILYLNSSIQKLVKHQSQNRVRNVNAKFRDDVLEKNAS